MSTQPRRPQTPTSLTSVIVTGGSGFIGQATCRDLEKRGIRAIAFDHKFGDNILTTDLLNEFKGIDAVIHLAGVLGTAELYDQFEKAVDVNIKGTWRVLEACRQNDVRYVGITMPITWGSVYQITKSTSLQLAESWNLHFGVRVSHVRAYNVFGIGQKVNGVQKIIPTFSTNIWRGRALPIWGNGDQKVDLIHVDDVARMLVDAAEFGDCEVFDAATGSERTVLDVAEMIGEAVGCTPKLKFETMRVGETGDELPMTRSGWDLLGWRPKFSASAFRETVEWYREDRE